MLSFTVAGVDAVLAVEGESVPSLVFRFKSGKLRASETVKAATEQ
ncbi:hypothetical protein [Segnochrobactrum spirostomi]|nr:hypothetical protein [Segnochrobactrum spirostomi]